MQAVRTFHIDGHTMAALAFNEDRPGIPIVFIHGITSSIWFWTVGQTPLVTERFRWYALSLPGHHPATFPPGWQHADITPEMMAGVSVEAIRQVTGGGPVILVGHSTGGFSALNIAAHCPDMVRSVISVAGFAHGRWIGPLGLYQRMVRRGAVGRALYKAIYRFCFLNYAIFRTAVGFYAADRHAALTNPVLDPALKIQYPQARQLNLDAMIGYFARMPDIDITDRLAQITAPVLALAGEADPIVPPDQARVIAETVPNGTLTLVPGAGHLVMLERGAAYHAAITDWLVGY